MSIQLSPFSHFADDPWTNFVPAKGEIDVATAPIFHQQLHTAIDGGTSCLVVDMTGVTFMGLAGITELVIARNRLLPDGKILLCHVPPMVRRLLEITGLDTAFPIEE